VLHSERPSSAFLRRTVNARSHLHPVTLDAIDPTTCIRAKDEGDITGTMTITDQSADIDSRAFNIAVTNLRYAFTNATKTFGETMPTTLAVA